MDLAQGADAQSQLDLFQEVLDEVGENIGKGGNDFGKKFPRT